jgi:hypothetical protein
MLTTVDAALAELEQEPDVPEGETSLELLQAIYRDKGQPLNVRVKCAVEALPHEYGRVTAAKKSRNSFADELDRALLERAIARSQSPLPLPAPMIEHEPLPASELKRPFSNYKNNYRRY